MKSIVIFVLILASVASYASSKTNTAKNYIIALDFKAIPAQFNADTMKQIYHAVSEEIAQFGPGTEVLTSLELIDGLVVKAEPEMVENITANIHSLALSELSLVVPFGTGLDRLIDEFVIVEEDRPVYAYTESFPWGIGTVKAREVWDANKDNVLDKDAPAGKGVKVCVIDTGIDHQHKDLKALFKGGYDFINNDKDPMDDNGHGTHVSGTIAARLDDYGVVGVAPEVELYGVKVLSASGSGSSSSVIQGIEWATKNKMDIISMSLGSPWPSKAQELALQKAFEAGVLNIAASGNSGKGYLGYPAAYDSVVAVGAIDNKLGLAAFSQFGKGQELVAPGVDVLSTFPRGFGRKVEAKFDDASIGVTDFAILAKSPTTAGEGVHGTIVAFGLGKPEDFSAKDCKGRIALIKRGELKFHEKTYNAQQAGCIGVVLFNNEPGNFKGTLDDTPAITIPAISISLEDGQKILTHLDTAELAITIKVLPDDFAALNGTSMACPHVSGVAALVKSAFPKLTNAQIREILTKTATDLGEKGYDEKFGNGLVDAAKATKIAAELAEEFSPGN